MAIQNSKKIKTVLKSGDIKAQIIIVDALAQLYGLDNVGYLSKKNIKESLLGNIVDYAPNWEDLIWHCVDSLGVSPYQEVDISAAHCILHKAIMEKKEMWNFLQEWVSRGLNIEPSMTKNTSVLALCVSSRPSKEAAQMAAWLIPKGASWDRLHDFMFETSAEGAVILPNERQYAGTKEVSEPAWMYALRSESVDILKLIDIKEIFEKSDRKMKSGPFEGSIVLRKWFENSLSQIRESSAGYKAWQKYLWENAFQWFDEHDQNDILLHTVQKMAYGRVSKEAEKLIVSRMMKDDDVAYGLGVELIDVIDNGHGIDKGEIQIKQIKQVLKCLRQTGGMDKYGAKSLGAMARFADQFPYLLPMKNIAYEMIKKNSNILKLMEFAIIKLSHGSLFFSHVESDIFKGSEEFWVKECMKKDGFNGMEILKHFHLGNIILGEKPAIAMAMCKKFVDALIKHGAISEQDVLREMSKNETSLWTFSDEFSANKLKEFNAYMLEIERRVLLSGQVQMNIKKIGNVL